MPVRFVVTLALCLSVYRCWAAESSSASAALEECSAYSEAGMRECLAKKSRDSEIALHRAEEKAVAALSKWDEDEKYVLLAKERLAASGRTFGQYRDAQCAFASSLGGGAIGNALEMRRLACTVELNSVRARALAADVAHLPSK